MNSKGRWSDGPAPWFISLGFSVCMQDTTNDPFEELVMVIIRIGGPLHTWISIIYHGYLLFDWFARFESRRKSFIHAIKWPLKKAGRLIHGLKENSGPSWQHSSFLCQMALTIIRIQGGFISSDYYFAVNLTFEEKRKTVNRSFVGVTRILGNLKSLLENSVCLLWKSATWTPGSM